MYELWRVDFSALHMAVSLGTGGVNSPIGLFHNDKILKGFFR
ncbi:hypothetical protein PL2TA16_01825 [Pseudoalteromonas luteoviolacea 2ta16]|uniref:Uncharacterized protein n=1 Tax=Pseudoalteromonas luteoviolacea (strain 2ta16) TaxID=1353533 RepID=V4GZV6_PSEL2|nr:hypothetical protein PL2TA16_01825 [Pseudoalteromonas luteoviolacea 2ta16]